MMKELGSAPPKAESYVFSWKRDASAALSIPKKKVMGEAGGEKFYTLESVTLYPFLLETLLLSMNPAARPVTMLRGMPA